MHFQAADPSSLRLFAVDTANSGLSLARCFLGGVMCLGTALPAA